MSDLDDHAYDDEGNVVLNRYGPLSKQSVQHGSIRPVSSSEHALNMQRHVEEQAERNRQKALARAEEKKKQDEERAARFKVISPISPQKRALHLDDQSEDKRNALGADQD